MRSPVTFDPLTVLLEHNRWATRRVLELCRALTPEQFHQRLEIGPGSLHDALRHLVTCMRDWADDIAGRPDRMDLERSDIARTPLSIDDLERLLDEATDEYRGFIESSRDDLASVVNVTLGGTPCLFTRGVALVHPLVHGTHHRAQCLNMLRRLNVPGVSDRLPDLDVNDWQYETESKP